MVALSAIFVEFQLASDTDFYFNFSTQKFLKSQHFQQLTETFN